MNKKLSTIITYTFAVFLVLILVLALGLYIWIKSLLPQYKGSIEVKGISNDVEILRDKYGMPHIYADNKLNLYFAFGYVVAQDRLLQMDLMRRTAAGELAEVLGEKLIPVDKLFRTLKAGHRLQDLGKYLTPEIKALYQAYAKGVNYFIKNRPLPIEFSLIGYKPKPWHYSDSIAPHYHLNWMLNNAFYTELSCYLISKKFNHSGNRALKTFSELCPSFKSLSPNDTEILISKNKNKASVFNITTNKSKQSQTKDKQLFAFLKADAQARTLLGISHWGGSNSWAISANKSEQGQALLANDMHLGFALPGIWYEVHLSSPNLNISGVTIAGAPHIIVGSNTKTAWAFTNGAIDDSDFYIEKLHPTKPDYYKVGNGYKKMRIIKESIPVKGKKDVTLRLRLTRHGPIINDISTEIFGAKKIQGQVFKKELKKVEAEEVLAMRWMANEKFEWHIGLEELSRSENIDDVKKASRRFTSPAQNFVYADKAGNIGSSLGGCVPKRNGFTGFFPLDGASGRYEWGPCLDRRLFDLKNPKRAWIGTANERHSSKLARFISNYYSTPYRSMRIHEFMNEKEKLSKKDFQLMHNDTKVLIFQEWKPILEKIDSKKLNNIEKEALQKLLSWDGFTNKKNKPAASIFFALWSHILENTFSGYLNKEELKLYLKLRMTVSNAIRHIMANEESALFDNPQTQQKEKRMDIVLLSFKQAISHLEEKLGSDLEGWDWGKIHKLTYEHPLGKLSPLLGFLYNRGPFPVNGGYFSLNPMIWSFLGSKQAYDVYAGASMRYIFDLEDIDSSLRVIPAGISGNFLSPHYDDQIPLFLQGKYRPFVFSRSKVIENTKHRLVLKPAK